MEHSVKSIRPFIGAKDFEQSRDFYRDLGFQETVLTHDFCYFQTNGLGFYLQNGYIKDWIDNTMLFLEVDDVEVYWRELSALNLPAKYRTVRLIPIRVFDWGRECYLHDPSGVLWHIGEFDHPNKAR